MDIHPCTPYTFIWSWAIDERAYTLSVLTPKRGTTVTAPVRRLHEEHAYEPLIGFFSQHPSYGLTAPGRHVDMKLLG